MSQPTNELGMYQAFARFYGKSSNAQPVVPAEVVEQAEDVDSIYSASRKTVLPDAEQEIFADIAQFEPNSTEVEAEKPVMKTVDMVSEGTGKKVKLTAGRREILTPKEGQRVSKASLAASVLTLGIRAPKVVLTQKVEHKLFKEIE